MTMQAGLRGSSIMQPAAAVTKLGTPAVTAGQISSQAFDALAASEVAPDAEFFHKYYR